MPFSSLPTVVSGSVIATSWGNGAKANDDYLKSLLDGTGGAIDVAVPAELAIENDALFRFRLDAVGPLFNVDTNDYLVYNRSANTWHLAIGGANVLTVAATGLTIANDAQFLFRLDAAGPLWNADTNDYMFFDRSANVWRLRVASADALAIDSGGKLTGAGIYRGSTSISTASTGTFAHGLGAVPSLVFGVYNTTKPVGVSGVIPLPAHALVAFTDISSTNLSVRNETGSTQTVAVCAFK